MELCNEVKSIVAKLSGGLCHF